jgi:hypothetical protein
MRSKLPSFQTDQRLASHPKSGGSTGIYSSQNSILACWSSKPTSLDMKIAYKT